MSLAQRFILVVGLLAEGILCLYPPMAVTMTFQGLSAGRVAHMFLFGPQGSAWRIELGRFMVLAVLIGAITALAWVLWPLIMTAGPRSACPTSRLSGRASRAAHRGRWAATSERALEE